MAARVEREAAAKNQPTPPQQAPQQAPRRGGIFGGRRMKEGGAVKKMAKGGSVSSASKRADGCAIKGKTKGKVV
jgi:hypothetical protein